MRHSTVVPRYGLANSALSAVDRSGRAGSRTHTAHSTADTAHTAAGNNSATEMLRSPSSGSTKAANAIPNGCAVCRIPIARPRCCGGNHPVTRRPLAVLALAAAMPPPNRAIPSVSMDSGTAAAMSAAAAVSAKPAVSTIRSPTMSSM